MEQEITEDSELFFTALPLMHKLILTGVDRERFPFTKTQLFIFAALDLRQTLTMKEIAGYIASSKEQATRAVAPLVEAGYLRRYEDPANHTRKYVCLTPAGRDLLQRMMEELFSHSDGTLRSSLSPEELGELHASLDAVVRLLSKAV